MIFLEMFQAVDVPADVAGRLKGAVQGLPATYKRLVQPTLDYQGSILGIAASPARARRSSPGRYGESVVTFGEVLVSKGALIGVVAKTGDRPAYREVEGGGIEILAPEESPVDVMVFSLSRALPCRPLGNVVRKLSDVVGLEFEPFRYNSRRFSELVAEGMKAPEPPTDAARRGARLLADKSRRALAVGIKSSGGILLGDAAKQLPPDVRADADRLIGELQEGGLVSTEVVVICTRTSTQVARAASRELLEQSAAAGIVCACGRALTDERVEEALTVTEGARELLDGSRWMSIVLMDELLRLGVPLDRILLEQQSAGDEMDCFADVSGDLLFFELKDKEFNLGSAYSFGAKIGIFQPELPVIVTTEYVGNDAKEHFQRAEMSGRRARFVDQDAPRQVHYIEGIEQVTPQLSQLVSDIYLSDGVRLLSDVLPLAALDARSLAESFAKEAELGHAAPSSDGQNGKSAVRRVRSKPVAAA